MKKILSDKRGDFASIIYTLIAVFAIGIILLLYNNLFGSIYHEVGNQLAADPVYNNTEVHQTINKIESTENSTLDYASLGISFGYIFVLFVSSYLTRINRIFFWIYGILSVIGMLVAVLASNIWQEIASAPDLSVTITHFPITNALLGTYYPTFALFIIIVTMILLFGKPPENG